MKGPLKFNCKSKMKRTIDERETRPSIRLLKPRELKEKNNAGQWIDAEEIKSTSASERTEKT
jgi:hypothetical protein